MEDRIKINGMWYVKEDKKQSPEINKIIINDDDVTHTLNCVWETDEWCFEATTILFDNAEMLTDHYKDAFLKITDKRNSDRTEWVEHNVDNSFWFFAVLEGNEESLDSAYEIFDEYGIEQFRAFLTYLIKIDWLIKD